MQRRQIAFFDERGKVGAQPVGKRHRQQRIAVPSVAAQPGLSQILSTAELLLETCALSRVGFILLARGEDRVVFIELRFQHAEAAEFGKQDARRLACRPHRIFGVHFFPRLEFLLRAGKIQIVEAVESATEPC